MIVIKSYSVNLKDGKYKLDKVEIKLRNFFSLKKLKKEKSKIKVKPLFKSEEIGNKKYINKNKRMSLNNKESLHNSINTKFKSLKEREIIMKNSDLFLRDSKVRMKNHAQLELLTPFLAELQKKRKEMNFKDFCILIDRNLTSKFFSDY